MKIITATTHELFLHFIIKIFISNLFISNQFDQMHRPERPIPFQKLFKCFRFEDLSHFESSAGEFVLFLFFGHFQFDQFWGEETVGTDLGGQVIYFIIESISIPKKGMLVYYINLNIKLFIFYILIHSFMSSIVGPVSDPFKIS